jgi:TusE/DsrC/DsvC family sulfur relay protein
MNIAAERDSEGYLFDTEDIILSDKHWCVIKFIREYFLEHDIVPDVRHVTTFLADKHTSSIKEAKQALFNLFLYGYVKQDRKIAGMRKPRAWSTG